MPRQRAPRRVAQERNREGYLAWVQHLLDASPSAWISAPEMQAERLVELSELIQEIGNWAMPERQQEFTRWCLENSFDPDQLYNWSESFFNTRPSDRVWNADSGYATLDDAIQAALVALVQLLSIVRRV